MSVISVAVDYAGRTGGDTSKGVRTYTARWIVRTNNALDGQTLILADQRIPRQLSYYQYGGDVDRQALVQDRRAEQDERSPLLWHVTIEYSTDASGQSNTPEFSKSIDLAPKYSWGEYAEQRVLTHDVNGRPIVNSSGEMFDPPVTVAEAYPLLRVTRAELSFNPLVIMAFKSAINNAQWGQWPAYSARCTSISANQEVQEGVQFWRATYEFAFKLRGAPRNQVASGKRKRTVVRNSKILGAFFEDTYDTNGGWIEYILDRGTMGRDLEPIKDQYGVPVPDGELVLSEPRPLRDYVTNTLVSSPVLLDGAGGRLIKNATPLDPSDPKAPQPIYLPFHIFEEKDFNLLQINPNPA